MKSGSQLITSLRREIRQKTAPLLEDSRRVALLDFPDYSNVGDSAIWLGGLALLRDAGISEPAYVCDQKTFDPETLRRRVGDGPILLSGGGNLGDLYPRHQRFRERVLRRFPDNPVVQLPQSIWFEHRRSLERARKVFDAHPKFTLLVRDRASLKRARRHFSVRTLLCPDMAFALGALRRTEDPERDVLWLLRTGPEAAERSLEPPEGAWRADWAFGDASLLARVNARLRSIATRSGVGERALLRWAVHATYEPLARSRLQRGIKLLSGARRVVTDRLHGHILCLLLGIPHRLLDNANGKVGAFYRTWTSDCELAEWSGEPRDGRQRTAGGTGRIGRALRPEEWGPEQWEE